MPKKPTKPSDDTFDVGERIKQFREKIGKTQREIAKSAGISQNAISKIEAGISDPTVKTIRAIARALGVRPGKLID